MYPSTFDQAVDELISSLSLNERSTLIAIDGINPLVYGGEFIGRAVRNFNLQEGKNEALLRDIAKIYSKSVFNMDFLATSADPMIAATLIVEAAQKKLREILQAVKASP